MKVLLGDEQNFQRGDVKKGRIRFPSTLWIIFELMMSIDFSVTADLNHLSYTNDCFTKESSDPCSCSNFLCLFEPIYGTPLLVNIFQISGESSQALDLRATIVPYKYLTSLANDIISTV